MAFEFRVYIDEAGDDGFVTNPDSTGSSRWFVLSALVIRTKNEPQLIKCLAQVRTMMKKSPLFALHFRKLNHDQKKAYVTALTSLPMRAISVMAHKFAKAANPFTQKDQFYRYMTRLLLERVSWLCRDTREQDGSAELIFSNRGSMSYADVTAYLELLKTKTPGEVKIDWSVIDPAKIKAISHDKRAGLQAADAIASSSFAVVRLNQFGQNEPAYAAALLSHFYRHTGALWNYGIKWWPEDFAKTIAANPYLKELAAWK